MTGLGGLNKAPGGVVIGLVQLQLPVVVTRDDLARQAAQISALVTKARKGMSTTDLVVFPEYALHGLSMDTNPQIMCRLDGPEVATFKGPARARRSGAASPSWSTTRTATPTTAGSSSTPAASCACTTGRCTPDPGRAVGAGQPGHPRL